MLRYVTTLDASAVAAVTTAGIDELTRAAERGAAAAEKAPMSKVLSESEAKHFFDPTEAISNKRIAKAAKWAAIELKS